jgi:hypothetical protein
VHPYIRRVSLRYRKTLPSLHYRAFLYKAKQLISCQTPILAGIGAWSGNVSNRYLEITDRLEIANTATFEYLEIFSGEFPVLLPRGFEKGWKLLPTRAAHLYCLAAIDLACLEKGGNAFAHFFRDGAGSVSSGLEKFETVSRRGWKCRLRPPECAVKICCLYRSLGH